MEPKGAPPVRRDKSIKRENVERGSRANTGGDHLDRSQGKYSKAPTKSGPSNPDDRL